MTCASDKYIGLVSVRWRFLEGSVMVDRERHSIDIDDHGSNSSREVGIFS
jgi:hypothetical protein